MAYVWQTIHFFLLTKTEKSTRLPLDFKTVSGFIIESQETARQFHQGPY